MYNPESQIMNFEVIVQGEGLSGESLFSVSSKSTANFELMYLPVKIGNSIGMISFLSPNLGEIWYNLFLTGEPTQTIKLPQMSSEIGKSISQDINMENPINSEVVMKFLTTNQENFEIQPKEVKLGAFENKRVSIVYTPTLLSEV